MIEANQEITVTLIAAEWQLVMNSMAEQPYRVVAQVIAKLEAQMRTAAPEAFIPPQAEQPLANGHATG